MSGDNRRRLMSASAALFWAVLGGVIGTATAPMTERAMAWVAEQQCHGHRFLADGTALRREAIKRHRLDKHLEANAAFQRAWDCGLPEGQFYLSQALCHPGWRNASLDTENGWAGMKEAVAKAPALAYLLSDPDACPM